MSQVYQIVTDRILESLSRGIVPWRKPWAGGSPKNLVSGKAYRGVNVFLLGMAPFASPWWVTFNQAKARGGSVKKGSKGTPVVFWKVYDGSESKGRPVRRRPTSAKPAAEGDSDRRFVLRYYTVFNVEQCEGLEAPASGRTAFEPIAECERIAAGYAGGPPVHHGGDRACYAPGPDEIHMPARETFTHRAEYYSTLFHEMTHSTGHEKRLARKGIIDRIVFGSHAYSCEELVAECGAAFLCARAGIETATLDNSAAYIAHWSRALRDEPTWMVTAAGQAAKAADLIAPPEASAEGPSDDESEAQAA